jgi:hypothetical protein
MEVLIAKDLEAGDLRLEAGRKRCGALLCAVLVVIGLVRAVEIGTPEIKKAAEKPPRAKQGLIRDLVYQ